jgi:peptidoglycan/xylan/chitin deacetylase (PgdA/CDA1 family)
VFVYETDLLVGSSLPDGVLCLTYDDGPGCTAGAGTGPRTLDVARFLADQGVPATFFMTGTHVEAMRDAPREVASLGHTVANHTYTHPDLRASVAAGGDCAAEVRATDALIRQAVDGPVYLRPPYGSWSPAVAAQLNAAPDVRDGHVGPVGWDIDGQDWDLWRRETDPQAAAQEYLAAIAAGRSGIVLMHDSTADCEQIKARNATYEMTRILLPELVRRGFGFVALADVALCPQRA